MFRTLFDPILNLFRPSPVDLCIDLDNISDLEYNILYMMSCNLIRARVVEAGQAVFVSYNQISYHVSFTEKIMFNCHVRIDPLKAMTLPENHQDHLLNMLEQSVALRKQSSNRYAHDIYRANAFQLDIQREHEVAYLCFVSLTSNLLIYQRKKDPETYRAAIFNADPKDTSAGTFGVVSQLNHSLSFDFKTKKLNLKCKQSQHHCWKARAVKFLKTANDTSLTPSENKALREAGELEIQLTNHYAPELRLKSLIRIDHPDDVKNNRYALMMAYVSNLDLFEFVCKGLFKSDLERIHFCLDLAAGILRIHTKGGVHRDIKPENIMVWSDERNQKHAQLVDFFFASKASLLDKQDLGTPFYVAPEVCQRQGASFPADVYSFGLVIAFCFCYLPHWKKHQFKEHFQDMPIFSASLAGDYNQQERALIQPSLERLILQTRALLPNERITLFQVIESLEGMKLLLNPSDSLSESAAAAASPDTHVRQPLAFSRF